jgi:hypothetical protein
MPSGFDQAGSQQGAEDDDTNLEAALRGTRFHVRALRPRGRGFERQPLVLSPQCHRLADTEKNTHLVLEPLDHMKVVFTTKLSPAICRCSLFGCPTT